MPIDHQRDFVVRGKYAFPSEHMDPRVRHNDFTYQHRDPQRALQPYDRYRFSPAEFYNSIQREGRAYDLADQYRRHDAIMRNRNLKTDTRRRHYFQRSDDAIADTIHVWLTEHPDLDATDIIVDVNNGEVILTGYVDSRVSKRLAEDICEDVRGVRYVENRLRIQPLIGNGVSVG